MTVTLRRPRMCEHRHTRATRAAFERAQKQPSPLRGGHGPAYRARARRRTRSRR